MLREYNHASKAKGVRWSNGKGGEVVTPDMLEIETFTPRESFNGRLKHHYWGYWPTDASENKAKRLCKDGEIHTWEYAGDGLAKISIGTMVKSEF